MGIRTTENGVTTHTHKGLVVDIVSTYLGDCDSMYWAVYLDIEKGKFERQAIGYTPSGATVDAPENIKEIYLQLQEAEKALGLAKYRVDFAARMMRQDAERDREPSKGKRVSFVKGRKVPVGSTGEVKFFGETAYGLRALVLLDDGQEVWTNPDNLSVIQADSLVTT